MPTILGISAHDSAACLVADGTLDEVLGWLKDDGFAFVNSIPKPVPGPVLGSQEQLFAPRDEGTGLSRMLSQLANMSGGYREGGFFIVIGQRQ